MESLVTRIRHWFGFFIVLTGTVSASYAVELEKSVYRKDAIHEMLQYHLVGKSMEAEWTSRKPSDFAMSSITHPDDIYTAMTQQNYIAIISEIALCVLGAVPLLGCDQSGLGVAIYQSGSDSLKYVGVSFAPERRLTSCELTVSEVLEFNVLNAEVKYKC